MSGPFTSGPADRSATSHDRHHMTDSGFSIQGNNGLSVALKRSSPRRVRRTSLAILMVTLVTTGLVTTGLVRGRSLPAGARSVAPISGSGYRLVAGDGGIFSFGAAFVGSAASDPSLCPANTTDRAMPDGECRAMATTTQGLGYWVLNSYTGAITPFGDAGFHGDRTSANTGGKDLWPTSVGLASTVTGAGYWMLNDGLSGMGQVVPYGDATFYGDESTATAGRGTVGTAVGIVATPSGGGYWTVDSDGGVFAFGDARFFGSMGGRPLHAPIVGMATTANGGGYWLVGRDGGVFAFGDATFGGSMAGASLRAPVVGIAADVVDGGYWLAASDGGVFALGGARFLGSMGGTAIHQPVMGISASAPIT